MKRQMSGVKRETSNVRGEAPGEFFRAALVRAGGVLEHLAECAPDAVTREQARDALSAPVREVLEWMRVLERVAAAARVAVDLDVEGDDGVGMLLAALEELERLPRWGEIHDGNSYGTGTNG